MRSVKPLAIRLLRKGCANRPFYHIVAVPVDERCVHEGIEQLGVYDPLPNEHDERILALNVERFKYYVAEGAWIRSSVGMLLGAAGILPLHPHSLKLGWINRNLEKNEAAEKDITKNSKTDS